MSPHHRVNIALLLALILLLISALPSTHSAPSTLPLTTPSITASPSPPPFSPSLLTSTTGPTENLFKFEAPSVTDGEDTIIIQASLFITDETAFHPTKDVLTITSSILPDINRVHILGYCRAIEPCINQTKSSYSPGDPLRLNYLLDPSSDLENHKKMFFIIKFELAEYILVYPVQITLSLLYTFGGTPNNLRSPSLLPHQIHSPQQNDPYPPVKSETKLAKRYFFESIWSLYWNTPCSSESCTSGSGLKIMIDTFQPPNRDDGDTTKFYAFQIRLSDNVYFQADFESKSLTCSINYYKYRILVAPVKPSGLDMQDDGETTDPTSSRDHNPLQESSSRVQKLWILLEEPDATGKIPTTLPWYDISTLDISCSSLELGFGGFGKEYMLSFEVGLISDINSSSPRFTTFSTNTDIWRFKRFRPNMHLFFKPTTYGKDGTAAIRGVVDHKEAPSVDDRMMLCGLELASTVSFSIHQAIKNKWGESVWKATFPSGTDITSKVYLDVFDPALNDWELDQQNHETEAFQIQSLSQTDVYRDAGLSQVQYGSNLVDEGQGSGKGGAKPAHRPSQSSKTSSNGRQSRPSDDQRTANENITDESSRDGGLDRLQRFQRRKAWVAENFAAFSSLFTSLHAQAQDYASIDDLILLQQIQGSLENGNGALATQQLETQQQQDQTEPNQAQAMLNLIHQSIQQTKSNPLPHKTRQQRQHEHQLAENDSTSTIDITAQQRQHYQQYYQQQQQQQQGADTGMMHVLSSPVFERTCIHIYPFQELERVTTGLYWFLVSVRLAPQETQRFNMLGRAPTPSQAPQLAPASQQTSTPSQQHHQQHESQQQQSLPTPPTTFSPLQFNPDEPIRLTDILYMYSGQFMTTGVGLFNWAYRFTLTADKVTFFDSLPTFVPPSRQFPHPHYDCENDEPKPAPKALSALAAEALAIAQPYLAPLSAALDPVWPYLGSYEEDIFTPHPQQPQQPYDQSATATTTPTPTATATDDPPLEFDQVYPYSALLPTLRVQIAPPGPMREKVKTIVLLSMQHHVLQSKSLLSTDLKSSYFFDPMNYIQQSQKIEGCTVKVGTYADPTTMAPVKVLSAVHVDSITILSVDEFYIDINPEAPPPSTKAATTTTPTNDTQDLRFNLHSNGTEQRPTQDDPVTPNIDAITVSCSDLYLISESRAIFEKPSSFSMSLYSDWIALTPQQLRDQEKGQHDRSRNQADLETQQDHDHEQQQQQQSTSNFPHQPLAGADGPGGHVLTRSHFWTVLTNFHVEHANTAQCQDIEWPEPNWRWSTSTIALVAVISVLALALIIVFLVSTKCVRRFCVSRVSNIFGFKRHDDDEEYDEVDHEEGAADEQELNQLDIDRFNNQLKRRSLEQHPSFAYAKPHAHNAGNVNNNDAMPGYHPPVPMATASVLDGPTASIAGKSGLFHGPQSTTGEHFGTAASTAGGAHHNHHQAGFSSHHSLQVQLIQQQQLAAANQHLAHQQHRHQDPASYSALSPGSLDLNQSIGTPAGSSATTVATTAIGTPSDRSERTAEEIAFGGFWGGGLDSAYNIKDHYASPRADDDQSNANGLGIVAIGSPTTTTTTTPIIAPNHTPQANAHSYAPSPSVFTTSSNLHTPSTLPNSLQQHHLPQPQPTTTTAPMPANRGKLGGKKGQQSANQNQTQAQATTQGQSQQTSGAKKKLKNNYGDFL